MVQKKEILHRTKRFYKSKSFWGAMIFALGLWAYTSLNGDYVTIVEVPLVVKLPVTRAIENPLRPKISVEVKGKGWNLFDLFFFNTAARVYIDLTSVQFGEGTYEISRNEIVRGIQYFKNLEAVNVYPEFITLQTGIIEIVKVPVQSRIRIIPRSGFTLVGDVRLFPDSIEIKGNKKVVNNYTVWSTKEIEITDVTSNYSFNAELSDTLSSIIQLSQSTVRVVAAVQQEADIVIDDIKVNLRGGTPPPTNRLIPPTISIVLRGGIDIIANLNFDDISASLDYTQILQDTTGILKPEVIIPRNLKLVSVNPPWIYHLRQISQSAVFQN